MVVLIISCVNDPYDAANSTKDDERDLRAQATEQNYCFYQSEADTILFSTYAVLRESGYSGVSQQRLSQSNCLDNFGFYGKGRKSVYDQVANSPVAQQQLSQCGDSLDLEEEVLQELFKFTRHVIYGDHKSSTMAEARAVKWKSMKNKSFIRLPPDEDSLRQHCLRANYLAYLVRTFKVECKASLGKLIYVKLSSKPFMGLDNQWFCNKILVTTPEDGKFLFPCYRWLGSEEKLVFRHAKASLVFQDTNPIAQRHRMRQLEERREIFGWKVYAEGMPHVNHYESALDMPAEVRFSFSKNTDFFYNAGTQLAALKLAGLADSKRTWESINQLDTIICENRNKTIDYVEAHWDEDEFFGYQLLNGLNPMMIQRCSKLPVNFPVTEEMVKDSLGGSSLKVEMKKGNIFLCDYKMLDGLVGNEVHGRQQYLTAPLVLLYCDSNDMMLPIAIQFVFPPQLGQKAGVHNPIFLPTDSKTDWQLVKIYVRAAEFSVQEVDIHLLRTHLLAEVFTMATWRNLPFPHPLFKLLIPHTRYTFQINILARNRLISEDGSITKYSGIGGAALEEFLRRATASLTYSSLCLPDNISERGLDEVPHYYYRDDGMKMWNVINKYVEGVLQHYYKSDDDVKKDTELQSWISEIFTKGFQERKSTGIPESFQAVRDLIKFVTMMIFTVSAQHGALNNGQFEFGSWMPNFPTALRKPPPEHKGRTTKDTILETLPDVGTTVNGMAVLRLLSTKSTDHYPLGVFPEELYDEEVPCTLIEEFRKDLRELTDDIEERNKKLELPYTYLDPKNVDNSVAI
ncbi:polyunsaturated fatty acid lipoxygenase ALOX15B-like [Clupea harengus]|uniref:Polyunsaturated fatty acid lipoxygenase ALOX15B-like n=1 Tax=Clupea harengus TaxID=7950 RepID=A0A8M1K6N0_CLUHA|nr:polyunsaturated fatty acid lipoxygenase ALOX15B-like [Clupea harengus]